MMWRLKSKISKLMTRGILRLIAWVCNRGEYGFEVWNLLTCLRSFDGALADGESDYMLKELTIQRIRAIAGFTDPRIMVRSFPLSLQEQVKRDGLLDQTTAHFKEHYQGAIAAIRSLYRYDLKTEEPWKAAWKS